MHGDDLADLLAHGNHQKIIEQQIRRRALIQRTAERPRRKKLDARRRERQQRAGQNQHAEQPARLFFNAVELIDADKQNDRRNQRREGQIIIQNGSFSLCVLCLRRLPQQLFGGYAVELCEREQIGC